MAHETTGHEFGELSRNWGWLLAFGVLSVCLGVVGLGRTVLLTFTSVFFFGVLLLVNGGAQLIHTFWCRGWKSMLSHILIGILYVLAGLSIVGDPVACATTCDTPRSNARGAASCPH